ncbi:MAG TPA: hypothetical protein VLS49_01165 [Usitatibacter sp.]|nr:hypothetical protein [Usitatibacter sp.]
MSLIGYADLDRPVSFASGRIYYAFGGGPFRLEPSGCGVAAAADGTLDFRLDLLRALTDADSRASLALGLAPQFAMQEALGRVRDIDPGATLSPCVLTDWSFRLSPTPGLRIPTELGEPVMLASNGLGSARLVAELSMESGLILEAMLRERTPLAGLALAQIEGVSPRVAVVVRFEASALLRQVLAEADASGTMSRDAIVAFFARDPASLPVAIGGDVGDDARGRFAETMADRVVARFGRYVPARAGDTGLAVQLEAPSGSTIVSWALLQPVLGRRQVALRIDLLAAAQAQADRLGLDSIVHRDTLATLPSLGRTRVTALCNLPAARTGVEALGVNLSFPPHLPERPQARTATIVFEAPGDTASADVTLSPGEPVRYWYSAFAVFSDDEGEREIDAAPVEGAGSPLHLSPEQFPVDFALVEASQALAELALVSGVVSYESAGRAHSRAFTLDSGNATVALAVPKERTDLRIDALATARDGSGSLPLGAFETLHAQLDVTSFSTYGPRQAEVRCVFDDNATVRAVSLLPDGLAESDDNVTTLSFTPAESARTFRWFARSPFHPGFRYRAYDPQGGAWSDAPASGPLVVYSSKLKRQEAKREVAVASRKAIRESAPLRLGRRAEAAPVNEAAIEPVATSPAPQPTDELLYARISDPSRKLYVPRYVLDEQSVSGEQRYRVAMTQGQASSTLEVNLVAAPAPAIAEAARDAAEYPHTVKIRLEYLVAPPAGATKALEFSDVTRDGANVKAVLTFATLQERDDVYRALTEPEHRARLMVQRFIDVSVPQPPAPPAPPGKPPIFVLPQRPIAAIATAFAKPVPVLMAPVAVRKEAAPVALRASAAAMASVAVLARPVAITPVLRPPPRFVPSLPVPKLVFAGMQQDGTSTRLRLAIENWAQFPDDFFAPAADLPPGGARKAASRAWVDVKDADSKARLYNFCALNSGEQLSDLALTLPAGTAVPRQVFVTITDRRANLARDSNVVSTAAPAAATPPYLSLRSELDQDVAPTPFTFAPALHAYIFQGLTPAGGEGGLIRYRLPWRGGFHTYLQDASRPSVAYCFPDRFKIARRREAPFTPFATVRVNSREDGSDADVVFDYVVAPYTDRKRLDDARAQLLADARFGATSVQFQPFASSDVRYYVDRPTRAGSVREQRADAALVLQGALKDTLTMPLGDFQILFDAMQRSTASLFMGHVDIDVPHADTEVIPFEARMDDLEGEMFSYDAAAAQDGSFQVAVRNDIESPVNVQTLDATFSAAGGVVRGTTLPGTLPHEGFAPGETLTLTVSPEAPLPARPQAELAFDLGGVTVVPDAEAIWTSILDRSTTEYFRMVTVRIVPSVFDAVQGREDARIAAVLVAFEGGGTAELNATTTSAQVRIDYSIDDVVLRRPVSGTYRYTVTVVRANGTQDADPQPREQSAQVFYVSVVR